MLNPDHLYKCATPLLPGKEKMQGTKSNPANQIGFAFCRAAAAAGFL